MQYVEISTIAHATDDLGKVQLALRAILPESVRDREIFTRRYMQGHYGNPIVTFDGKLTKPRDVNDFVQYLQSKLSKSERLVIARDLDLHSDGEGNLFVRVDRQQAFRGIIEVGEEDPIRIRFKFTRFSGDPKDLMKAFLESE